MHRYTPFTDTEFRLWLYDREVILNQTPAEFEAEMERTLFIFAGSIAVVMTVFSILR